MLKSIQQKLVLIFVLIIIAIMLVLGTFLFNYVTTFYHTEFLNQMRTVFNQSLIQQLTGAANEPEPEQSLTVILDALSVSIGIDSYRHYYILDGKTGKFLTGSNIHLKESMTKTKTILDAMTGLISEQATISEQMMEYAIPLPPAGLPEYVVYIVETKEEMGDFLRNMLTILLQSLLLGVVIAMILGFFLAKTVTTPITGLTKHAEKLAKGEFEKVPSVSANDELGILSNTFKYMSETLSKTLAEIAFEKNKLETVMQYMSDGIIAFDADGVVLVINPAAKAFLDITEASDINFDEYFRGFFDDLYLGDFIYLNTDKHEERTAVVSDKTLKFYFGSFQFENDQRYGVIVVISDITKQESIESARREFVANVSHELKTPITTIKSYVETILENDLDNETETQFLQVVNKESDRMTRLVQDLLTLSRLDSKIITQNRTTIDVSVLIKEVLNNQLIEVKKYNHTLSYHQMNELPPIFIDRDRLEQILINVISNAIKYTPPGGLIEIYTRYMHGNIYIKVKDNGIGIPPEDLNRIFERFYRVDKARSREQGGTGLGLAISKEMLSAIGGDIFIESAPDVGTEACIILPIDGESDFSDGEMI